jgi:hypothetical protein
MLIKSLSKEIASGRVGPNAPKGLGGFTIKSKGKSLVDNHSKGSWNLIEGNPIAKGATTTTRLSSFIKVNSQLGYYFLNKRFKIFFQDLFYKKKKKFKKLDTSKQDNTVVVIFHMHIYI